jgi:hypothetical protein
MQYQSPFEDWYTYSTVHKPLPDFTCEPVSCRSLLNSCQVSAIHWSTNWEKTQRAV